MSLSGYWAQNAIDAVRSSRLLPKTSIPLAFALGPVRSIVRIIDDSQPPMQANWSSVEHPESHTDMAGTSIAVNPTPILRTARDLDAGDAIDFVVGFALHEAAHAKHSRLSWAVLDSGLYQPKGIAAYLWNLAEDPRIEEVLSAEWPGFAPYFPKMLDWLWRESWGKQLPDAYGPSLRERLQVAFFAVRYRGRLAEMDLPPDIARETEWWHEWSHAYCDGRTETDEMIRSGLDHLAETSSVEEMEGASGTSYSCVIDIAVSRLDKATAANVDRLVRENLTSTRPASRHDVNTAPPSIFVRKPEATPASRAAYIGTPDATVERLRAALAFRPVTPRHEVKLQRTGELDDEELYRWAEGDDRLYTERLVESEPDVVAGLLVDLSGSMEGPNLVTAQRLAQLFVWALHEEPGIRTQVWGHTDAGSDGNPHGPGSCPIILRLWEPSDPLDRLGLITTLDHYDNFDGYAIEYCVTQLLDLPQRQKVLFVLSDGVPMASYGDYGGPQAIAHVFRVVRWAESMGVTVIQLAIDAALRADEQAAMFGHNYVMFEDEASLPRQLAALMERAIR